MAYNEENRLRRIIEIQEITLDYKSRGVSQKFIYENIIFPRYYISFSCYCNYLSINAKMKLNNLEAKKRGKSSHGFTQQKLFDI